MHERIRRRVVVATVKKFGDHDKENRPEPVAHKHFAQEQVYKSIKYAYIQSQHCLLFLANDQNMDSCSFTSTKLAKNREMKFHSLYGVFKENPGEKDRRRDNRGSILQQGDVAPAGSVGEQRERPEPGVRAPKGEVNRSICCWWHRMPSSRNVDTLLLPANA